MLNMIQNADWAILHWIQENLRCGVLDVFLPKLTLLGEGGAIWIAAALAMLATKKYRKYGLCLGLALVAGLLICNIGLKNIVARPRPCWLEAIDLLVKNPRDYSFPSGHTWSAVTGAWVVTAAAMPPSRWQCCWHSPGCICLCIFRRMYWQAHLSACCWASWLWCCASAWVPSVVKNKR